MSRVAFLTRGVAVLVSGLVLAGCGSKATETDSANAESCVDTSGETIKVGALNSLSGTMAISEVTVRNADVLSLELVGEGAVAQEAKRAADEWEKASQQIGQSLSDSLMQGGKSGWEYIKGLFRSTVLKVPLQAFVTESQKNVTGTVRLKLYKGNVIVTGRKSDDSLFDANIATFEEDGGVYNQADAGGFIKLNALRKEPKIRFDWTPQLLTDMARWANRRAWRYTDFAGYDRSANTARRSAGDHSLDLQLTP